MLRILVLSHNPPARIPTEYLKERHAQDVAKYVFLRGSKQWIRMLNIIDMTSVLPQNIRLLIFG